MSGDTNRPTDTMYSGSEGSAQPQIADGGPAFAPNGAPHPTDPNQAYYGMSLRDWFAGQALAGLMANTKAQASLSAIAEEDAGDPTYYLGKAAYEFADALLKARGK